jgi:ATP-dependent Clp protease ATP-binding subunit ClpB
MVREPSVDETVSILRGLKERYEIHHGVRIKDRAIVMAARLSDRYISDRFLPDKAIDLIDEAASKLRLELDSQPAKLTEIDQKLTQLQIEKKVLEKEEDKSARNRFAELEREIAELGEARSALALEWQNEKEAIQSIRATKEDIEEARRREQQATRENNLETLGEIRYGLLPDLAKPRGPSGRSGDRTNGSDPRGVRIGSQGPCGLERIQQTRGLFYVCWTDGSG